MAALEPEEPLMVVRTDLWRFAVRLRDVDRVLFSAMPVGLPSSEGSLAVQLSDGLVPVVFGASLFGADEVSLLPEDKMVVLASAAGRTILWVSAVEDIVPFVAVEGGVADVARGDLAWVSGVSGGERTLAIVDAEILHQASRASS